MATSLYYNSTPLSPTSSNSRSGGVTSPRYVLPRRTSIRGPPALLPGITESSSPTSLSPTSPSLLRPSTAVRSVSVASFLSDGTIEIEGFGFDGASDAGDDMSVFGESMYEGSVYDGEDSGRSSPDLSRRAERVLASAKKRLDLCGQNISRARSSLILSPMATPATLVEHLEAVGPHRPMQNLHSHRFKLINNGSHLRAQSESSVPSYMAPQDGVGSVNTFGGLNTIEDLPEQHPSEIERPQSEMSRSKSTQQMRVLRDQMKDLRGKITHLQQQTRSDSLRRKSNHNLRAGIPSFESPTPTLDEIRPDFNSPVEDLDDWHNADDRSSIYRKSISTCSERHEEREDAFSYDALFYGNGIYANKNSTLSYDPRPHSMGSDSTSNATVIEALRPPPPSAAMCRKDSQTSIDSFATASSELPGLNRSPSIEEQREWLTPLSHPNGNGGLSSPGDDGYHSAPHTPQSYDQTVHGHIPIANPNPNQNPRLELPFTSSTLPMKNGTFYHHSDDKKSIHRKSSIAAGGVAIDSTMDSLLVTSGDRGGEIELRLVREDRELIEQMIEGLGKICCSMETEREEGARGVYRKRLAAALKILEGRDELF
ncbi:hypothetical protein RUND412_000885 [Rhizina undulata]